MRDVVALVLALLATGCALRFELDPDAVISCSDDCLDNRFCRAGFCLTQEAIASPPAVVSSASLDREQASARQVVTAVLTLDGVLRDPPTLALGTSAFDASQSDGSELWPWDHTTAQPSGKIGWFTGPLNASSAATPGVLAFDSSALGGPRLLLDPVTNEIWPREEETSPP